VLIGDRVQLHPVREKDLSAYIDAHYDLRSRGAFFPLGVGRSSGTSSTAANHDVVL
jgi:hypothetical protein